jgi:hypothetical protein
MANCLFVHSSVLTDGTGACAMTKDTQEGRKLTFGDRHLTWSCAPNKILASEKKNCYWS